MCAPSQGLTLAIAAAIGAVWIAVAVLVGWSGMLGSLPRPAIQGILFLLTAILLTTYFISRCTQTWIDGLGPKPLIALHLSRFVGIYFLVLYDQGRLPMAFAVYGGWGDIIVAAGAVLLISLPMHATRDKLLLAIWNAVGLLDILFVVASAARAGLREPASMTELTRLPLSLLPTLIVPLVIASHVVMFAQLLRSRRASDRP